MDSSAPGRGSALSIDNISHRYGNLTVLNDVSTRIAGGEFLTLLGASGSGKTTLLRIIGGLISPSQGRIRVGERDITGLPPERRDIGFVFQNYALFPHMTVAENVAFSLSVRSTARQETARRVNETLELVGLKGLGGRYPGQLSGGQQQRVALARALVFRPGMLLLDEPLGALDRHLRQQLAVELRSLQRRSSITMVYVTHDQEEAFTMSTQVAVMTNGIIRQMAPPADLYRSPDDLHVARFVGDLNEAACEVTSVATGQTRIDGPLGPLLCARDHKAAQGKAVCALRPEHLLLRAGEPSGAINEIGATVRAKIFCGSWHRIDLELAGGTMWRAEGRGEPPPVEEGGRVSVSFEPDRLMLFSEKGA
ncbi:ABC transporter ATP-binding protein [Mesorhizobium sp. B3-1-3]|uniref:ABC transporter ATP-binding protein n=1 Tax=unclassified Mesorhizobium TaxID=325217 RepID=UPI001128D429|nr:MULTISPECIES: ABC transporter ATP-binding protein [unclassified Mesorhizobium]TPI67146.1 ABC transporter ATP-binding protein [Mesorhizobium sp. B3-1-8]TPI70376.1 ABC transporter ATP-binding protein [Mesorhizobium sp. B3-1-3]